MRPTPAQILKNADLPAFLITNLTNIRYLTGLDLSAGLLLATSRRFVLFVDGRYREAAVRRAPAHCLVDDIESLPNVLATVRRCGFEAENVTIARKDVWKRKFPNTKFIQTIGVIDEFRRQKGPEEITLLRRAEKITKEILRRVPAVLRRGTTEEKLARQLLIWALDLGADGLSFEPIVAFGNHTSSPHHRPTSRALTRGHIVQIDVGAKLRGYCADLSAVYFTGTPTKEQERAYAALLSAQRTARKSAKTGVAAATLDTIARAVLKKAGIEKFFTHSLGHGVGLDVHEGVTLSTKNKSQKLLKHEVITLEPGVYFPGKWGMRVEEMVYVS